MSENTDNRQNTNDDPLLALAALVRESCHSINNPLTAILGETQLLLLTEDSLSDEQRSGLKTIESMAYRIRDLVSRLRNGARTVTEERA